MPARLRAPKAGQFFIAIHSSATSGGGFYARMFDLIAAIAMQDGARLPGDGRGGKRMNVRKKGVDVSRATLAKIHTILP